MWYATKHKYPCNKSEHSKFCNSRSIKHIQFLAYIAADENRLFNQKSIRDPVKRIDFFCSDPSLSAIQERIAAYRDAMHVYAQDVQDGDICYITGNTRDEIVSQLEAYYASRPLPDAIFVAGNKPLLSVFSFFHEKGIRCPEDVRLIGFGSSRWAAEFQPGISLCCPDVQQIGSAAINLLMEWILALEEDRPIPAPVTKLTQAIIEFRASFGSPEEISRARAAAAACIRTEK